MKSEPSTLDRMLRVHGTVQGVGFRPFVLRIATRIGIRGWVINDDQGVLARVLGTPAQLDKFADQLLRQAPQAARITDLEWLDEIPSNPTNDAGFSIRESNSGLGEITTDAPLDIAPCDECRRELNDPTDRRHNYAFINCTQCGPRYTIIERLPYDRPQTTMAAFTMCPACQREYTDPQNRRFHAEPNACPVCGPQLQLTDGSGNVLENGPAALTRTANYLTDGYIVAVKGVGGFHLMADATSETAVANLRRRKHREEKPFAVMFRNLTMLRKSAVVSENSEKILSSPQCPMVLVAKKPQTALAAGIAPNNPWLGALLPSAPLHLLLFDHVNRPLVATSANLSDEPLCTDDDEARQRLAGIADYFLGHNRVVARPVDDSIVRFTPGGTAIFLRRARGYAPASLTLPAALPHPLICVGAHMKNTVAVASERRLVLSPHIGDLGGAATHRVFAHTIDTLTSLLAVKATAIVCDKHPDYHSTRFAIDSGLPIIAVQHHLAHVLAVLLEHDHPADGVLGFAWDGTGYGEDGTVWGGECILLQSGQASRFARLRPFRLPGGEAAVRDARRVAVALADLCDGPGAGTVAARLGFTKLESSNLQTMLRQGLNSPVCTSAGRLFDAFAVLLELGTRNSFEGQLPLAVEIAALGATVDGYALPFGINPTTDSVSREIDWRPALTPLLDRPPRDVRKLAAAFHRGLVEAMLETATLAGVKTVVLSGGCFQNALLRHFAETRFNNAGFSVLAPRDLPPGDGAIAAGQALGALWNLTSVSSPVSTLSPPIQKTTTPTLPCASLSPEK
jgi:hydrogenase maturation protein HypF